jgi:dolichol-phosphate mannosyltransferase
MRKGRQSVYPVRNTLYQYHQEQTTTPDTMTAASDCHFSLVIPAYNEEKRIGPLFDAIGRFDGELIVVCDGTDATAQVVEEISRTRTDLVIRCLTFSHDTGKGGCVIAGLSAARAPLVGFFNADGSTTITEMERLFSYLLKNDCAIGSRWASGANLTVRQGLLRRLGSRIFNVLIRCLLGLDFHDTQCGAKVFRKSALDSVLPAMVSRGFEFDVELLWRLQKAGCQVVEVPVEWQNTGDSQVRMRDKGRMAAGLFRVRPGPGKL